MLGVSPRALTAALLVVLLAGGALIAWLLWHDSGADQNSPVVFADFDPESTATVSLAGVIPQESQSTLARPVALVGDGERLFVALADGGSIASFDYDGSRQTTLTVPSADGAAVFSPIDLALLSDGRLVVADAGGERVVTIDPGDAGSTVEPSSFGPSLGEGVIVKPTAVAADGGSVFVADSSDGSVREYDESGGFVRRIEFAEPGLTFVGGLLARDGSLYVADSNANRVVIVDLTTGAQVGTVGRRLDLPRGIAHGDGSTTWVAEAFGGQIVQLDPSGQAVLEIIGDGVGEDIEPGDILRAPEALVWDAAASHLYVTDPILGRILVYNVRQEVVE